MNAQNRISTGIVFGPFTSAPTSAHIHGPALAGQNGPIVLNLGNVNAVRISGRWYGLAGINATITPSMAAHLSSGRWYIDVHTASRPNGEIRGQVRRILPVQPQGLFNSAPEIPTIFDSGGRDWPGLLFDDNILYTDKFLLRLMLEHELGEKWHRDEGDNDSSRIAFDDAHTETGHKEFSRLLRLAVDRGSLRPYR